MISLVRVTTDHEDFRNLVYHLDLHLAHINGNLNSFFASHNQMEFLQHVVVAYENQNPVGCGALKAYDADTLEIKRMFVLPEERRKGIACKILNELQNWTVDLGYRKCILETHMDLLEAISLYTREGFVRIPNYEPYVNVDSSVCFEKEISPSYL